MRKALLGIVLTLFLTGCSTTVVDRMVMPDPPAQLMVPPNTLKTIPAPESLNKPVVVEKNK